MGNMSYCRFENTAQDLQDCVRAIENRDVYNFNSYELNGFKIVNMDYEIAGIIEHHKNQD
jgi:hypothetical protein